MDAKSITVCFSSALLTKTSVTQNMIGTKGRLSHYNLYVCVCESLAAQGLFVAARGIFICGVWDLVP